MSGIDTCPRVLSEQLYITGTDKGGGYPPLSPIAASLADALLMERFAPSVRSYRLVCNYTQLSHRVPKVYMYIDTHTHTYTHIHIQIAVMVQLA